MDRAFHIFPDGGLDQSILVAVLVGVLVLLFFCEVFGWVWAGLVVPGYLVSVIAVAPDSAIAVCVEGVITFVVSRGVSDILCKLTGWSAFFGRERFFLIVLVSVVVRQVCELWLLQHIAVASDHLIGTQFGQRQDLASIGLVLVPLLANMFWKLTLPRGVFQIAVTVVITWLVVAKLLLPYTNLSFSSFQSTYEDVALDFLGSPKAYIILLTTAWLAAYGNLVYGWDYNGIMVPSLLALTWFQPLSLVRSIIEALILLQLTKWALRAPLIRHVNVEGPRKLAVVFVVGFLCKFIAGWFLHVWFPSVHLTDYFGFGYVLTSLLAVKMLTIKKIGRVVFPSLAVSLVGFILGSGIGLALHVLFPDPPKKLNASPQVATTQGELPWAQPQSALSAIASRTRYIAPNVNRLHHSKLVGLWRSVDQWLAQQASAAHAKPAAAADRLSAVLAHSAGLDMQVVASEDLKSYVVIEAGENIASHRGTESLVAWPGRPGPVLAVTSANSQRGVMNVTYALCEALLCRAVLFAGYDEDSANGQDTSPRRIVDVARQAFVDVSVIAVVVGEPQDKRSSAELYVQETLGAEVNVGALRQVLLTANAGDVALRWSPPPRAPGYAVRIGERGFATLYVPFSAAYTIGCGSPSMLPTTSIAQVDGSLVSWVTMQGIRREGAQRIVRAATATEKLMLANVVVPSLLDATLPLACKQTLAQQIGMSTTLLPSGYGDQQAGLVFSGQGARRWFTLVVPAESNAAGLEPGMAFTASRGNQEEGTSRIASTLATRNRSVLLVAHGDANGAESDADSEWFAAHVALSRSLSNVAVQLVQPLDRSLVVDIRGFSALRGLPGDAYLTAGNPVLGVASLPARLQQLSNEAVSPLGLLAAGAQWVDGAQPLIGLQGNGMPQISYRRWFGGADFVAAWFSSEVRTSFSVGGGDKSFVAACALAAAICSRESISSLFDVRHVDKTAWTTKILPVAAQKRLQEIAVGYQRTEDPANLRVLMRDFKGYVTLGFDIETQRTFVAVRHGVSTHVYLVHSVGKSCRLSSSRLWSAAAIAHCGDVIIAAALESGAAP